MPKIQRAALVLFLLFGLFAACNTGIEACTDPGARNFDPAADSDCCCEYFQWQLRLGHYSTGQNDEFGLNTPYSDARGTGYSVVAFDMYISDLALLDGTGNAYEPEDSTAYFTFGDNIRDLKSNMIALNPEGRLLRLGKFSRAGEYLGLRMVLGLGTAWQAVDPDRILNNPNHPLRNIRLYDSTTSSYTDARISISVPNIEANYLFSYNLGDTLYFLLPQALVVEEGQDVTLDIGIYYHLLFDGVDFFRDSEAEVRAKIEDNLPLVFGF